MRVNNDSYSTLPRAMFRRRNAAAFYGSVRPTTTIIWSASGLLMHVYCVATALLIVICFSRLEEKAQQWIC